jgi:hypothetical protein
VSLKDSDVVIQARTGNEVEFQDEDAKKDYVR